MLLQGRLRKALVQIYFLSFINEIWFRGTILWEN